MRFGRIELPVKTKATTRPAEGPTLIYDSHPTESRVDAFLRAHIDRIVIVLAIFAAIRILAFCAAFPLSNNTDERMHLLTIRMYAQGHLPGKDLPQVDP